MTNRDNFDNRPDDDDDDSLDWLSDDSLFDDAASSAKKSDATGFTGELPWMQDDDDEAATGDDDELSWLSDDEPLPTAESGIGADLDWGGVDVGGDDDDELSWLADDEASAGEWQSPNPEIVNTEFERQLEAAEAADFGDTDADLDWLVESADINTPPTGGLELPDWMSGMDVPEVSDDDLAAAHASVSDTDDDDADMGWLGGDTSAEEEDDLSWLGGTSEEEEESVTFSSLLGNSADDTGVDFDTMFASGSSDDDDSDSDFAPTFASSSDDDDDLGFLSSSASTDDDDFDIFAASSDDDEAIMPTASGTSGDSMWGDVGKGFTQEMPSVDDEEAIHPVNEGWGIDFDADEDDVYVLEPAEDTSLLGDAGMDDAFAAMFPDDEEESEPISSWLTDDSEVDEPDWMQQIESPAADDDLLGALGMGDDSAGELDDLLAGLDTGTDSGDVDDLLAALDVGDDDIDMDDLLAELEGVDTGDDLDDLLAQVGESETYDDAVDPLDFHTGITDMFDNVQDEGLDFLAETESELEEEAVGDEYDDMPLAFDSGVTEMFDAVNSDELDFLLSIEAETEGEEYDDALDPLAFNSGITDLLDKPTDEELDLLASMEEELAADAEYDDAVEPLAFDSGLTDLINSINTQDLVALSDLDDQLEEETYDDAVEPLAFDSGLTDLFGGMNTGDLEALDSQLEADDELDFSFLDDLGSDDPVTAPVAQTESDELDFDFGDEAVVEPVAQTESDELDFSFLDDLEEDEPVAQTGSDELDFDFGAEDEPVAQTGSDELDFDFGAEDEPVAAEADFDFSFDGEAEEEPAKPVGKRDSGLLKRATDNLSDLGFDDGDNVDWLAALDKAIEDEESAPATSKARESDLNVADLLGSLDSLDDYQVEEDEDFVPIPSDLDDIFDEYDLESLNDDDDEGLDDDLAEAGEIPEWLRDVASGKGEKYEATKVIRGMQDRSLDDLDERLLDLRERGLELSSDETDTESDRQRLTKVVPNIGEALVASKVLLAPETAVLNTEPRISAEQLKRAELLRSIVGEATAVGETSARPARRRRLSLPIGRWVMVLLLAAAVLTPFFISDFNFSEPPVTTFNGDFGPGSGLWGYQNINNLQHEDVVLFAVEYGATGARELDNLTETLLTHILHQGARPVIVSSDPVGALRAERIAAELAGADGYNLEYYMVGFLPGGSLGLRDLTENLNIVVADNTNGQATGLTLNSLNDFKTIILIAEGGETVRDWMEQVVPETTTPLIVAIGQSARPLAQSYVDAHLGQRVVSLLIGYPDALAYQAMLIDEYGFAGMPSRTPAPTATTAPTNTPEPTATSTPRPTKEPEATSEAEVILPPKSSEEATEAVTEEDNDEPTRAAATATEAEPTEEPSPTQEAVDPSEMVEVALIQSTGMVNVREGPGAGFNVIGTVQPEQRVRIIGRNDAGDWLQIVLPDGTEAWIASFLAEIELVPESEAESLQNWGGKVRYMRQPPRDYQQGATNATPTATPESQVIVGRNASGSTIDMFDNADLEGTPIEDLSANTEFVVLTQSDAATQILLIDGRTGWIETRFIRAEAVPLSESGFEATNTPTPTPSSTPTLTPTATNTPTPTATPFTPDVFPQPLTDVEARWNAMTFGLLAAILLIFVGNVYWIMRWLRHRGD